MARATEATAAPDTAEVGVAILETEFLVYNLPATVVKRKLLAETIDLESVREEKRKTPSKTLPAVVAQRDSHFGFEISGVAELMIDA